MYQNLFKTLRVSVGVAILMLGIIGILLPFLQGWILIMIAIPIISPEHGKRMVAKLKEWKIRFQAWFNRQRKEKK